MFKLKLSQINPKIAVTAASALIIAGMISVIVVNSSAAPATSEVKGVSTATPEVQEPNIGAFLSPKPSTNKPSTTTPAPSPYQGQLATGRKSSTVASILLAQQPDTEETDQTPSTDPVEPTPPVTPEEPEVPVTPVPQPTFAIDIQEAGVTSLDVVGIHQLIVPFNVIMEPGFVMTTSEQPQCAFLSAPVGHNVLCNVSQKEAGSGTLSLQYTDLSSAGHYVVEIRYSLNGVIRTDAYAFDLPVLPVVVATVN